jgi:hypothetical protein
MIDHKHQQYKNMESRWQKCRDASAGEHNVHEQGELYLPKLTGESDTKYKKRKMMTPFFGATWRTIKALRGMMFRKPPETEFPESMQPLIDNIDYAGNSLISFAQKVALESLTVGRLGVLVEYTQIGEDMTRADAQARGARPFFTMYNTESILNWDYFIDNGRRKLSMVHLREDAKNYNEIEIKDGEEIHRVLMLEEGVYVQRVYVVGAQDDQQAIDDIIPRMNNAPLPFIPFQFFGSDSLDADVEIPPLMDLVDMNFHHYRQSSSYEHGCFISGLPSLFIFGNNDDTKTIYLGGSTANSFPDPQASAQFVEVTSAFDALLKNLDRKEQQMAVLGARMLESQKSGVESAEALERRQSGDESILADMSQTLSAGLTTCLQWLAQWSGVQDADIYIRLNREFLPAKLTAQEITALMGAHIQRGLSYDSLFFNLKRGGMYPDGRTLEEERGLIDEGGTNIV